MTTDAPRGARLSRAAVTVLAVAAGGAIANDYALQPTLTQIADGFGAPLALVTVVLSAAMLGYLLGLALLVPLIDVLAPRRVIPAQLVVLALALTLAAAAPSAAVLIGCFVLVGAATTVAAQASAVVGKHSDTRDRAHRMAAVSAGISAGILLSRVVGGILTDWLGWRGALLSFAAFVALCALALYPLLPTTSPQNPADYFTTVRALPRLLRDLPELRRPSFAGMLWFFAFNLIWVGLAIRLAAPPYNLDATSIGLYSLAGILGLIVTRIAGRLSDRYGPRAVILAGTIIATGAAVVLILALGTPVVTAIALAIFDAGCFAAQVANQARVVSLDPERAGALGATYLTLYYAAGAAGTLTAGFVMTNAGWTATAATAAITVGAAAALTFATRPRAA